MILLAVCRNWGGHHIAGLTDVLFLGQHLADADAMLWQIQPDPLPERAEADRVSLGSSLPC